MKKLRTKKGLAIVLAGAISLAGAGAALAYFTTTGSGSGSGVVGTSSNLTINQDSISYSNGSNLVPGTTGTVTLTVTNASSAQQYLGTISLSSWTSDKTGCDSTTDPGWITMPDLVVNQDFAPGTDLPITASGGQDTITFNDVNVPQDVCQGANLTFNYSA